MKKITFLGPLIISFLFISCQKKSNPTSWSAGSPEGNLTLRLSLDDGELSYRVTDGEKEVVHPSPLGLVAGTSSMQNGLTYVSSEEEKISSHYTMLTGKRLENNVSARETRVHFKTSDNRHLRIDLRAYPDGVAFRYAFPDAGDSVEVTEELTGFNVGPGSRGWMQGYNVPGDYDPAYETPFQNGIEAGTPSPDAGGWCFPLLFEKDDHWLLITETDAKANYFASHIAEESDSGNYQLALPFTEDGQGKGSVSVVAKIPFSTPWRVIMIGSDPSVIVESNLVHHLATPNKIENTDWITPGRSAWSWWSDHSSSRRYAPQKDFVDLAAEMDWEYSLVDANWNRMTGGDIGQLLDYARQKEIGLTLWYNSGGDHNVVGEQPRDRMFDPVIREKEMEQLEEWGVKGIKVDFFQSDKPFMMASYIGILEDAAAHHLLVDFHGCTMPRGWSRTYPNLMSMEGIRGAEQLGWSNEYAQNAPMLNTIVVFTRNVIGPMDYTPVTFSSYDCCEQLTTNAHQLALAVLFESGIQHFADSDSSYLAQSEDVLTFLRKVPVTWDDTRLISGRPGEDVVLARRKGSDWYLSGINGQDTTKELKMQLPADVEGDYIGQLLSDGADNRSIASGAVTVKQGETVPVEVLPYGGFTIHLVPNP